MRTLNKALCLVLALVMILGLGAFSVSAETTTETTTEATVPAKTWSDADKIKYDEAAAVLATIGVMEGRDDGTYDPQAELNRQEGAVMITRLLGQNPTSGSSTFLDIDNPFYQPYLAYVQSQEIIAGYGDGNFGPYDKLTGLAFAKMLLGTLGYKADVEGMVGTLWELGVLKLVRSTELDDGLGDIDLSQPITREKAAHMLLNTLQTPMVRYDSTTNISVNGANVSIGGSEAKFLTTDSRAKQTIKGEIDTNTYNSDKWLIEFGEEYWKDLRLVDWGNTHDDFGRPTHKWSYKNAIIGTYKDASDLLGTYTAKLSTKQLYELVGTAAYDSVKDGRSALDSFIDGLQVAEGVAYNAQMVGKEGYNNYDNIMTALTGSLKEIDIDTYMHKTHTDKVNGAGNGTVTEVYLTPDNDLRLVTYHTWMFEVSNSYNGKNGSLMITSAGDTDIRLEDARLMEADYPEIKNWKAGDKVLVTATYDSDKVLLSMLSGGTLGWGSTTFKVQDVELAQTLTGKVDSYRYGGTWNITVDGKTYEYSDTTYEDGLRSKRYATGQNASLVLDKYGYVIGVDKALTTKDYVFIREFGRNTGLNVNSQAYASAVFADGSTATIRVRSAFDYLEFDETGKQVQEDTQNILAGWGIIAPFDDYGYGDEDMLHAGQWYTYSKNSSNEYTLYPIEDVEEDDHFNDWFAYVNESDGREQIAYDDAVSFYWDGDGNRLNGNGDTILIVEKDDGKFNTYTGINNIPNINLSSGSAAYGYYTMDGKYVSLMYLKLDGAANIVGGNQNSIIYVVDYLGVERTEGKDDVWRYKVLDENAEEEEILADRFIATTYSYPAAYGYASISNGILTEFEPLTDTYDDRVEGIVGGWYSDAEVSESAGVLTIEGSKIEYDGDEGDYVAYYDYDRFSTISGAEIFLIGTGKFARGVHDSGDDYTAYKCKDLGELANLVKAYDHVKLNFAAEYETTNESNFWTRVKKLYVTVEAAADTPLVVDMDLTKADIDAIETLDNSYAIGVMADNQTYVIHSDIATFFIDSNGSTTIRTNNLPIFSNGGTGYSTSADLKNGENVVFIQQGDGGNVRVYEGTSNS